MNSLRCRLSFDKSIIYDYLDSTASSALNAMALVILEDIIKKKMRDVSDADQAKMCKFIGKDK